MSKGAEAIGIGQKQKGEVLSLGGMEFGFMLVRWTAQMRNERKEQDPSSTGDASDGL